MSTQANRAVLLAPKTFVWGWGMYEATFPAGTPCKLAVNQPIINGFRPYWIVGKPESFCRPSQKATKQDFSSWEHNYGFLVDAHEVEPVVKKKKS